MSLAQTIEAALEVNLALQISASGVRAADARRKARRADFLPTFSTSYQYLHRDRDRNQETFLPGVTVPNEIIVQPQDEYTFIGTVSQPLFAGFGLINQYQAAQIGLDLATLTEKQTRLDVIFHAQETYFSLLKALKHREVAAQTVMQISAQRDVAQSFYDEGLSPRNDLLQSLARLANAEQELVRAQNRLDIGRSRFNTMLRRPIDTPVSIVDMQDYRPLSITLDDGLQTARQNRLDIEIANKQVQLAEKEMAIAKRDYYPAVTLKGNYYQRGTDWQVNGGEGIGDRYQWEVMAEASWNIWEWGRTYYGVQDKFFQLQQAQQQREEILDNVALEVKDLLLSARASETNIRTVGQALEQARENYRINQERYKEQVATNTDVLDAQTLLAETLTNYYDALYDFNIATAALNRAMGLEIRE